MFWLTITCIVVTAIGIVFLWFTALSGTKFYDQKFDDDVGSIKLTVHFVCILVLLSFGFLTWKGHFDVPMDKEKSSEVKIENVETTEPAPESQRRWFSKD